MTYNTRAEKDSSRRSFWTKIVWGLVVFAGSFLIAFTCEEHTWAGALKSVLSIIVFGVNMEVALYIWKKITQKKR